MNKFSDKKNVYIPGLDYGRAIASIFVLLWHLHVFGVTELFSNEVPVPYIPHWSDILNVNILLQAVPFFIFLSCFLYAKQDTASAHLKRRLIRALALYLFWSIAYFLVTGGLPALFNAIDSITTRPLYSIVTGVGTFYFFFSLFISIFLTSIAVKLQSKLLICWIFIAAAVITLLQLLTLEYQITWTTAFWSPLNYLLMPPSAVLLVKYISTNIPNLKVTIWIFSCFIVVATIEWALLVHPSFFPGKDTPYLHTHAYPPHYSPLPQ